MKRPTQKDVARRYGVSRSTVSYVLNDQTDLNIPISAETRQRVLEAIAELGTDDLQKQFASLEASSDIDGELAAMKAQLSGKEPPPQLPDSSSASTKSD